MRDAASLVAKLVDTDSIEGLASSLTSSLKRTVGARDLTLRGARSKKSDAAAGAAATTGATAAAAGSKPTPPPPAVVDDSSTTAMYYVSIRREPPLRGYQQRLVHITETAFTVAADSMSAPTIVIPLEKLDRADILHPQDGLYDIPSPLGSGNVRLMALCRVTGVPERSTSLFSRTPKPRTIDIGCESDAKVKELVAAVNTAARGASKNRRRSTVVGAKQ